MLASRSVGRIWVLSGLLATVWVTGHNVGALLAGGVETKLGLGQLVLVGAAHRDHGRVLLVVGELVEHYLLELTWNKLLKIVFNEFQDQNENFFYFYH